MTTMEQQRAEAPAGLKIVDADTHYPEPWDLWTSRVPESLKERVPHVKPGADGKNAWFINGDEFFSFAGGGSFIRKDGQKITLWDFDLMRSMPREETHPASYDIHQRVALMDEQGVWAQIMYPNLAGFGVQKLLQIPDISLRNLVLSIYNDAMGEVQQQSGNRIFGQALVPFWDIATAVKEVRRVKEELHLTGIVMCSDPEMAGLPDLPNAYWDPLWEACGELEMPINFHVGASDQSMRAYMEGAWPSFDAPLKNVVGSLQIELANARVISNLLCSDILTRFPKTKWVSVESGIGWIPYALERLEYQLFESLPDERHAKLMRPTELFHRQVYGCFWFEQAGPSRLLDLVGVDNVMFETDFPHPTCFYPSPVERALTTLQGQSEGVVRKVMGDNATKLYHLPA